MMNVLTVFIFIACSIATVLPGTMYVSTVGDPGSRKNLVVQDNQFVVGTYYSTFDYHDEGMLQFCANGKYLGVDRTGKFFITEQPHMGFSLVKKLDSSYERILQYNGGQAFELCGDGSIGFNSKCEGAQAMSIIYKDIIQPR
ncbi:hypothetical protein JCM33374_g4859 [Metschnikowia sp. JCM 33374]|nr:hypothetical protein JCM33374_g4859 [Metschnikowia sp. JCM 33374]